MIDHALEYLDRGFSLIPVERATKKPYLKSWKQYQKSHPTEEEVERWWTQWPNANIAIITGSISGIFVVDADGPTGIEWMNTNLPKTGVYSITGKGVHALYKLADGQIVKNSVRLAPEVDIRGEGGYVVAPPSIHSSGHEYKWQFLLDGWEDLAEYVPNVQQKKSGNLNLDLSGVSGKLDTEKIEAGLGEGERDNMLFKEACRLRGLGLTVEESYTILMEYAARCNPPFPKRETKAKLEQAWKYDTNEPTIEATEHLEPEKPEDRPIDSPIPDNLLTPGGLLQEIMDYIAMNSTVSVPIFNMAAAVTLIGNVAGQKIMTETGLRTNIYSIALGYSGAGKNAAFGCIPQLLMQCSPAETLGSTELTSSVAILRDLSRKPICFILLDEIGMIMKGLKRPDSPQSDIPRLLTKLFSGTDRPEQKSYADGSVIAVPYHHLSLYGASTPGNFWESLTTSEVLDGFLARVLIWESRHDAILPKNNMIFTQSPSIQKQLNQLFNIQTEFIGGNLAQIPVPKTIPKTIEATESFKSWSKKYHDLKNKHKNEGISAIYGRAAEHASKLALIHSVSKNIDKSHRVDVESVLWSCSIMDHLIDNLIKQIEENIADNDTIRWKQKIIKFVKRKSDCTVRDLQRGPCQGLNARELKTIVDSLVLGEQIGISETKAKNGRVVKNVYIPKS